MFRRDKLQLKLQFILSDTFQNANKMIMNILDLCFFMLLFSNARLKWQLEEYILSPTKIKLSEISEHFCIAFSNYILIPTKFCLLPKILKTNILVLKNRIKHLY